MAERITSLVDRVAIVTGARTGIGLAIARALLAERVKVVAVSRSIERDGFIAESKCPNTENILTLAEDLTDPAAPGRIVSETERVFGGIDYLVNNAGMALSKPFAETTRDDWERIMTLNAKAPFFLTQAALPFLRNSEVPTVINIASVVATKGYPLQSAYGASKHALLGWSKAFAAETYHDGVRVHVISPGGVLTEMIKSVRPDISEEDSIRPENIADIVVFLLTHRGNGVIDEIALHRAGKQPWI